MKVILRGTMAHILVQECDAVEDIMHDVMLRPPEKYYLEIHFDQNHEVVSLIVLNIGTSIESLIRVLDYFAKKYSKLEESNYQSISQSFLRIIRELRKKKPLYPRNLFRFDLE